MIQSRHSRRRVPISLSQSELACGLRTGVVITLRPSRVSEASNSAEKIASWGVDAYEPLAKSLAFARRTPVPANGQIPPTDPRYEELERERRMDTSQRYTNPGRFSGIGRWKCW